MTTKNGNSNNGNNHKTPNGGGEQAAPKKKDKKEGVKYQLIEKRKKKHVKILKEEAKQIREAFSERDWSSIKSADSWSIFKIMAEFVEGFEKLAKIGPCITIFGSARTTEDNKYYQMARDIARMLVENGYGVITGGGPGIMEAGNRGAMDANGKSVGLNIKLPFEQENNDFIDSDKLISFDYFFVRKVMFVRYAQGFIGMPGGFGTLDEIFEALTLIQTKKIGQFPIVLVGKDYWKGLIEWFEKTVYETEGNISEWDFDLFYLVDTPEEAVEIINDFYTKYMLAPNF